MNKSLLKLLGVAAITWSAQASAAGIGGINVVSALGQPLKADIELFSVDKSEKSSLVARLATPEAYKQAGLDYPYGNKFKFTIESRADGASYIHATSSKEINDPFVSLLVELSWASGKLVREYTFLLDPVGYEAQQPAPAPVQAVAPAVEPVVAAPVVAPVAGAPTEEQMVEIATEPVPESEPVNSQPIEQAPPVEKPAKVAPAKVATATMNAGEVKVQRGDTLSKIAAANSVDGVSLERMLVALYRANVDQFDAKNMNRIKTGKILRMPDAQELEAISQADARKEIHAQVSDWNAYRQKMASAPSISAEHQEAQQVSAGKISSSVADKTPVAKEGAKEVLKLSKGDAVNDKVAAAGKATSQDSKNAAQEEAIAKAKAVADEQTRAALLEKNLQDMKRLAELKTEAAALANAASAPIAVASEVAATEVAASQVAAVSAVEAASAVKPVAKPVPQPVVVETSLIDDLLAEPLYLGGGAAALLGLGGLAFAISRRKNKPNAAVAKPSKGEDFGSTTGRIAAPVIPSPDTGDFTIQAGSTQTLATAASDDDPISEADLFLSFGRDVQAEEILKEALQTSANKAAIKMKLLEIYASRKDAKSFEGIAAPMKSGSDDQTWLQIAEMGRKIDPKNSLYGGESKVEDSDSATMQTVALSAPVDLTTKTLTRKPEGEAKTNQETAENAKTVVFTPEELAAAKNPVMDFDITATNPSMPAAPATMDFDVTATHDKLEVAGDKAESLPSLEDLVFDVTATHPKMPAASDATIVTPKAEVQKDDSDMPFTLDFPIDKAPKVEAPKPAEFDLGAINLNMDDDKPAAGEPAADSAQWHEVATKLDLAKAYQEMGDSGGAKEILDEVLKEGDAEQRAAAKEILNQLG
ncbi:MAG: FimV/HubP family polar landmark protein [Gallionella sp.]